MSPKLAILSPIRNHPKAHHTNIPHHMLYLLLLSDLYASRKSAAVSAPVSPASSAASAAAKRSTPFEINNHDWMEGEVSNE